MAIRGAGFKWYDGFFLSMLAFSIIMVVFSWERYHLCKLPLQLWIAVDYAAVFVFRLLMFVDNAIAAGVGLDISRQLRGPHLLGRVLVLSILYVVLYPFLWAWSVVGAIWFAGAKNCLPEKNQKWGFIVWLLFSFCGLVCLAGIFVKKWLASRQDHLRRAPQGTRISAYGVLVNMIRQPDRVFETAAQEMRGMDQDATYYPGMNLSDSQRAAVETVIQRLPIFVLKAVPPDCSDCPICLEEFHVGQGVRGLPCAHNFHVACIDKWLRLNVKCPRCRCSVFPNLNLNDLSTIPVDPDRSTVSTSHHIRIQPSSYLVRMQSFLLPIRSEAAQPVDSSPSSNSSSSSSPGTALLFVENGGEPSSSHGLGAILEPVQ
ncbi:E3 ubiquitin-protein ligase SIS3-like [Cynara cardunculus var. scolymus]|uniref:E3 ubiquitin-protein ligase SIS3-like n=1 Tax=Cynara cardunculus var. scolymus TaxID=59895 RepID=UPI000D623326|nr:E3 ubiquitin-protein ligase SIS3-like [Cynara cardunculus var. scolymus]